MKPLVLLALAALGSNPAAPPLQGVDPVSGKRVSLADYRGKPVVINVWGSWCSECVAEAVDLRLFAATHPQAQMLGIDVHDTKARALAFYRRYHESWPSIFDPSGAKAERLGAAEGRLSGASAPTTFFLDRRHRIVAVVYGRGNLWQFDAAYRKAVAHS